LRRDSPSQVRLQAGPAQTHTDVNYEIRRAFNTLQAWEDARQGDLVAENRLEVGVAYNDGPFFTAAQPSGTPGLEIAGATTDAAHYMKLTVAEGQRHNGTAGTGARLVLKAAYANAVDIKSRYTVLEWLEIDGNSAAFSDDGGSGVTLGLDSMLGGGFTLDHLLIHNVWRSGIVGSNLRFSYTVTNNILYNIGRTGIAFSYSVNAVIANNTLYNIDSDATTAGPFHGIGATDFSGASVIQNNIVTRCGGPCFTTANSANSVSLGFNISSDATATGANSQTGVAAATLFESLASGSENLHLKSTASAINAGTDLSGIFKTDIDNQMRPIGSAWDIGADEAVAGGGTVMPPEAGVPPEMRDAGAGDVSTDVPIVSPVDGGDTSGQEALGSDAVDVSAAQDDVSAAQDREGDGAGGEDVGKDGASHGNVSPDGSAVDAGEGGSGPADAHMVRYRGSPGCSCRLIGRGGRGRSARDASAPVLVLSGCLLLLAMRRRRRRTR
jgi:hypothetical protein